MSVVNHRVGVRQRPVNVAVAPSVDIGPHKVRVLSRADTDVLALYPFDKPRLDAEAGAMKQILI